LLALDEHPLEALELLDAPRLRARAAGVERLAGIGDEARDVREVGGGSVERRHGPILRPRNAGVHARTGNASTPIATHIPPAMTLRLAVLASVLLLSLASFAHAQE